MKKNKFSTVNNPAMDIINSSRQQEKTGYKPNPDVVETKSKRVQLLMQPSLYQAIRAEADRSGNSVNGLIHDILESNFM